jgi:hypothetical protein
VGGRLAAADGIRSTNLPGKVIGIDAWSAAVSTEGEFEDNAKWWNNQKISSLNILEKLIPA